MCTINLSFSSFLASLKPSMFFLVISYSRGSRFLNSNFYSSSLVSRSDCSRFSPASTFDLVYGSASWIKGDVKMSKLPPYGGVIEVRKALSVESSYESGYRGSQCSCSATKFWMFSIGRSMTIARPRLVTVEGIRIRWRRSFLLKVICRRSLLSSMTQGEHSTGVTSVTSLFPRGSVLFKVAGASISTRINYISLSITY